MGLGKKALARIIIQDPQTRKKFWSGTVYRNGIQTPSTVVKIVQTALGGLKENKVIKKKPKEDPDCIESDKGAENNE